MSKCLASSTLISIALVSIVACSDDGGSGNNDALGTLSLGTEGDGDGDGDPGDGDGDDSGDGDGSPGDGDGDDKPCSGVTCSGHGTCVEQSGVATCECDDGYVANGLECISCPTASGSFDIDIPMITVSGNKTINGVAVTASGSGYMYFINRETGDSVGLGSLGTTSYSVELIPGTYDLRYDEVNEADGVPDNASAIVMENISLLSSGSFDIDIPMITVSGNKTINGASVSASGSGYMYFVDRETGDSVGLGSLGTTSYSVELIPGTYDLRYDEVNEADGVPDNASAIFEQDISLQASGNYAIDVPMITVSGNRTINGASVTASGSGYMYFVNRKTGDSAGLGSLGMTNYTVELIPGSYDLRYDEVNEADGVPDNANAIVEQNISLEASGSYNIDIPMITVSGNKTINGASVSASGSGYMYFVDRETGDSAGIGSLGSTSYTVELIPGTYDLRYDEVNEADGVPDNGGAIFEENISLQASGNYAIDVPMITVAGNRTINGASVTASGSGYMYFVNRLTGDSAGLGSLGMSAYSVELIPGSYDLRYDEVNEADGVPDNANAIVQQNLALQASGNLALNVPMVSLVGDKTINGTPVSASGSGYMYLINRTTGDSVGIGSLGSTSYAIELIPGTYELRYDEVNEADGVPDNAAAILSCVQIQ